MTQIASPPPWYRQFWPWFLIALPASAVIAGVATLLIASHEPDGVVVDDYYKQGLAINQDLDRDRRAAALGVLAQARLTDHGTLEVQLHGQGVASLAALRVSLLHPTKAGRDHRLTAKRMADGSFQVPLATLEHAHWHVILEPSDRSWRLQGRLQYPEHRGVTLAAAPATRMSPDHR